MIVDCWTNAGACLSTGPQQEDHNLKEKQHAETEAEYPPIPSDDLSRTLTFSQPNLNGKLPHIGLVGDTYTITVSGRDTDDRFCVIDMHIPPGGGPGPHRHDFEETFILLDGEIEVTFRGKKSTARAGDTVNIPSNSRISSTTHHPGRLA